MYDCNLADDCDDHEDVATPDGEEEVADPEDSAFAVLTAPPYAYQRV